MLKKELKVIAIICFCCITVAVLICGVIDEFFEETSSSTHPKLYFTYLILIVLLCFNKRRKYEYYYMFMEGKMSEEIFLEIIGKVVQIRTLDEYVLGICKKDNGDFLVVEKQKKNGVETTYVNKNSIQTIKMEIRK